MDVGTVVGLPGTVDEVVDVGPAFESRGAIVVVPVPDVCAGIVGGVWPLPRPEAPVVAGGAGCPARVVVVGRVGRVAGGRDGTVVGADDPTFGGLELGVTRSSPVNAHPSMPPAAGVRYPAPRSL